MNWLAMQVMYVADVEDKYPRMISSYIYKPRVTISAKSTSQVALLEVSNYVTLTKFLKTQFLRVILLCEIFL